MIFRNFAEKLLGSKVKLKLAVNLLNRTIPVSERELAKLLDVSHVAVNKAMKDFEELNLVRSTKIGTSLVWTLNKDSYAYCALLDIGKLYTPPLEILRQELYLELNPISIVREANLFGSVVSRTEDASSDIDLLIVCSDKRMLSNKLVKLTKKVSEKYGNSLHSYVLDKHDLKKSQHKKLYEESRRNGLSVVSR